MKESCDELGLELMRRVSDLLAANGCDCILFSGGIDTTFVTLAAIEGRLRPRLISVLFPGSKDEPYVDYVASSLSLELYKVRPSDDEALKCVDLALETMQTIDPIEVASAAAVCLGLKAARELGCRCVATGDGGDELYIGYDFLLKDSQEELMTWLKRVSSSAFFNSVPISQALGVKALLPLYSDASKEIAEASIQGCDVKDVNGVKFGKYLLRRAIELRGLSLVAWRRKDPITSGSGSERLLKVMLSLISDEEVLRLREATGIIIPSRPHAYLLSRRLRLGLSMPARVAGGCPICGSPMSNGFCRFCGAYLGREGLSVYSDDVAAVTGADKVIRSLRGEPRPSS